MLEISCRAMVYVWDDLGADELWDKLCSFNIRTS